ncbi:MAG: arylsulfatase [Verrucomicrobiaceae bacterium]|nr:arylsulfatase [Verrucomicrobiaceae bacterium]
MRALLTLFCFSLISFVPAVEKPDIVLFLIDDMGREDCGFMGGKDIKTPAIDKLASAGATLDAFYVMHVCSPTRTCFMTGRHPLRTGLHVGVVRPWAKYGLPLEERLLPQALKEVGYSTSICGKWHLGSFDKAYWPDSRGFDHTYGHLFGAIDYFKHDRDGQMDWYRNGQPLAEEGYSTQLIAKEAVSVIEKQPQDKPLFLYLPFNGVHAPHQVPDSYTAPYSHLKGVRKTYAGMLAAVDEAIGHVTTALEKTGRAKNTLYIFSSDNGGPSPGTVTDNGKYRAGKGSYYEGGTRVAAFATWEGHIKPGTTITEPLHAVDWYPTLLKLTGASLEQKTALDGRDILPVLTDAAPSPHDHLIINASPNGGALRKGDWKIVVTGTQNKAKTKKKKAAKASPGVELFNLKNDPYEANNLASANPEKVTELRALYDRYLSEAAPPKTTEGD